ncbi:MAG: nucleoid-structuring protein H-NS [Chitinivibrionales bacterium]|nr:nucleoid-structuring protein H-NS [Chitinivibrionales bacterium]MBD3396205.1 nucleoid-structuring protein H-NS [Chitinivibrionales bacterium]
MFRPEITVCDCTIRDGGLMNNSKFELATVRKVYECICASGVQIVELGYRNSKKMFSTDDYGAWRFCDEDMLRKATDGIERGDTRLAVMMDAHKAFAEDLLPKSESIIDVIRVATYVKDIDKAIYIANDAIAKGYQATINIMAVSHALERELDEALQQVEEETRVMAVYIVDSFGALYSEDVDYLVHKYKRYLKTKEVGMHCHNQQQLAYANTIEAIIKDVNFLDGTLYGLGRAAGNCPLELLIGFLKNPKFNILPLLDAIQEVILPLQDQMEWGYTIPYMISGMLNVHPQEAMKLLSLPKDDPARRDFVKFYTRLADEAT